MKKTEFRTNSSFNCARNDSYRKIWMTPFLKLVCYVFTRDYYVYPCIDFFFFFFHATSSSSVGDIHFCMSVCVRTPLNQLNLANAIGVYWDPPLWCIKRLGYLLLLALPLYSVQFDNKKFSSMTGTNLVSSVTNNNFGNCIRQKVRSPYSIGTTSEGWIQ